MKQYYSGYNDYFEQIALGKVPKHSIVNKFGRYEGIGGTEEIVAVDGVYGLPVVADTVDVTSDSVADAPAGLGAWSVLVQGLDVDFNEIEEIVELGATSIQEFIRVPRARVWKAGTVDPIDASNVGTITVSQSAGPDMVKISPNKGQTQCCCYTIPAGKQGLIWHASGTANEGKEVEFQIKSRLAFDDACFAVQGDKEAFEGEAGDDFKVPTLIPEKTDLVVTAISSASGANISADMQIELVEV